MQLSLLKKSNNFKFDQFIKKLLTFIFSNIFIIKIDKANLYPRYGIVISYPSHTRARAERPSARPSRPPASVFFSFTHELAAGFLPSSAHVSRAVEELRRRRLCDLVFLAGVCNPLVWSLRSRFLIRSRPREAILDPVVPVEAAGEAIPGVCTHVSLVEIVRRSLPPHRTTIREAIPDSRQGR